ncbi:MAG: hypothetical protein UHJ11_00210 [Paludibacteraceae bacterium]|nr:hypothetical protein [Paludibacteraceae bacterium]
MKTINITTMKHIVYILSIACLLVLGTTQAQAVDYKPYTGSSCVNQRYDAAAAPTIGFSSTSAYATDDWTNPTTPMLNADGSVSAGAYMGEQVVSGPHKAPGTPGGDLNQDDQQVGVPLGDALLPLLVCALLYILARRRKSAI